MDFSEVKERYKLLPMWVRIVAASLIGVLPAIYLYFEEGETLETELESARGAEMSARSKFESARQKKANLPKLEEQLAFTEEQLTKARAKLPDSYRIEEILQKSATMAREAGAEMIRFDPQDEKPGAGEYRYMEMPIATELNGRFEQIAGFFDRVVHLDINIFLRNLELSTKKVENQNGFAGKTPFELARDLRQDLRVNAKFEMVVFRSMTTAEEAAAAANTNKPSPEGANAPSKPPQASRQNTKDKASAVLPYRI